MLVRRLESYKNETPTYSLVEERVVATGLSLTDAQVIEALWNHKSAPQTPTQADLQRQVAINQALDKETRDCTPEHPCRYCQARLKQGTDAI